MTNIKERINSRKVVLIYIYEMFFVKDLSSKDILFEDIFKISKDIYHQSVSFEEKKELKTTVWEYYNLENWKEDIDYIITNCFKKELKSWETFDMEFIKDIVSNINEYVPIVEQKVNESSVSFLFKEMDIIDKSIFVLWYIEYNVVRTPKKVVINEMIELSKRFWDANSSKLVNWIWHSILIE